MKNSDAEPELPEFEAPPDHLCLDGAQLWVDVCQTCILESPAYELLLAACEAVDRRQEARAILAQEGCVIKDRFGQARVHPAALVERDAVGTLTRCIRALGLKLKPSWPRSSKLAAFTRKRSLGE